VIARRLATERRAARQADGLCKGHGPAGVRFGAHDGLKSDIVPSQKSPHTFGPMQRSAARGEISARRFERRAPA